MSLILFRKKFRKKAEGSEKLAAGEIRADLEQIAGGVKNAATDVQSLLKAMETMKQDIVPAIDAVQGSKDDAVAALGCLQVVLGGLADRMDELSKLAAACSSSAPSST